MAKVEQGPETTIIFMSVENENLVQVKEKLVERSPDVARRFHERYIINVAFFAWQQSQWKPPMLVGEEPVNGSQHDPSDDYKEGELRRASKTVVNALGREAALAQAEVLEVE